MTGTAAGGHPRVTGSVVLAHDYLTQRGGAERVVLAMARAFPEAPIVTSVYSPASTYPEFAAHDVRTTSLQRLGVVRRHHRVGLPLYPTAMSRVHVDAAVAICSTSGFAHGIQVTGTKVLYVHNTARWLYQRDEYLGRWPAAARSALSATIAPLQRWDKDAGRSADLVLANSHQVQARIRSHWGVDAEVLYPAHGADPSGDQTPVAGIEPGYVLAVCRLLTYKRVDTVLQAMGQLPQLRLLIVGRGPDESRLRSLAPTNCTFLGSVSDAELRWLYANSLCLVSAAAEDLGLAALEAMAFGRPVAVLRAGGFEETVVEGQTGIFFDEPTPHHVEEALKNLANGQWDSARIAEHAATFSESTFRLRLQQIVRQLVTVGPQ